MSKLESKSHTFYKQNGKKIQVNDTSLAYAKELGWTKEKPKKD